MCGSRGEPWCTSGSGLGETSGEAVNADRGRFAGSRRFAVKRRVSARLRPVGSLQGGGRKRWRACSKQSSLTTSGRRSQDWGTVRDARGSPGRAARKDSYYTDHDSEKVRLDQEPNAPKHAAAHSPRRRVWRGKIVTSASGIVASRHERGRQIWSTSPSDAGPASSPSH